jgi:N-acetylglucosaminyldiphosphoundecaprenol N-acetyl-beta-D-mannosaminyltransferase
MIKERLLGTYLSLGSFEEFISEIIHLGSLRTSSYVCVVNVHMLIEAFRDKKFNLLINQADIATPDGLPLVKSLNFLYKRNQVRVAGMDLMPHLLCESEKKGISIYFYGTTNEILFRIKEKIKEDFPSLTIAGMYSPPFRELSEAEKSNIINKINSSGANLVFVALGCPKQEKWMSDNKNKINACMIGLGGAFPVLAGVQRRAPEWMQYAGLEWLFRLINEPSRLWKRYLVTNTIFLILVLRFMLKKFLKSVRAIF